MRCSSAAAVKLLKKTFYQSNHEVLRNLTLQQQFEFMQTAILDFIYQEAEHHMEPRFPLSSKQNLVVKKI